MTRLFGSAANLKRFLSVLRQDRVIVVSRQEPHLVTTPADDDVEVIEDIATEDTVICRRWIGESSECALDTDRSAVDRRKLQGRVYLDDGTCATDAVEIEPRRNGRGRELAVS